MRGLRESRHDGRKSNIYFWEHTYAVTERKWKVHSKLEKRKKVSEGKSCFGGARAASGIIGAAPNLEARGGEVMDITAGGAMEHPNGRYAGIRVMENLYVAVSMNRNGNGGMPCKQLNI